MAKTALTVKEFCETYGVSTTTAYELLKAGELVARKIGTKTIIPVAEADRWLESLPAFTPEDEAGKSFGWQARQARAAKR
jgi:excisionase family DNA binding protein